MAQRPAVFLDRDGALIEDTGWPHKPEDARWTEGADAAVKLLNDAGYYLFVVTHQAGVAKGFYPEAQVGAMHRWMAEEFARNGAHFEYCPCHPKARWRPTVGTGCAGWSSERYPTCPSRWPGVAVPRAIRTHEGRLTAVVGAVGSAFLDPAAVDEWARGRWCRTRRLRRADRLETHCRCIGAAEPRIACCVVLPITQSLWVTLFLS